jgi:hypothetical protein
MKADAKKGGGAAHPWPRIRDRDELVDVLAVVRKRFDEGDDYWRPKLLYCLDTFLCEATDIPLDLIVPLRKMLLEEYDRSGQAQRHGAKFYALECAAAVVTVLKEFGHAATIDRALDEVAKASGLDRGRIKNFRDNLSRGLHHPRRAKSYSKTLANERQRSRERSASEILNAIRELKLSAFVSRPARLTCRFVK